MKQAGSFSADTEVLEGLQKGNADYEEKFGFIFIVCASGKSAKEMLEQEHRAQCLQAKLLDSEESTDKSNLLLKVKEDSSESLQKTLADKDAMLNAAKLEVRALLQQTRSARRGWGWSLEGPGAPTGGSPSHSTNPAWCGALRHPTRPKFALKSQICD